MTRKLEIDWNRPLRWVKGHACQEGHTIRNIEAISRTENQACIRCSCGALWLMFRNGYCAEKHEASYRIENYQEEQWINVWYDFDTRRVHGGETIYSSKINAEVSFCHSPSRLYIGTFPIEDK